MNISCANENLKLLISKIILTSLLICLFVFHTGAPSFADGVLLNTKLRVPNLKFMEPVSNETRQYLGLSDKKIISLADIKGSLIIIEVFSTYCTSCPRNVPVLNSVYSLIEKDTKLKGRVKIIGIAVGNNKKEASIYSNEHKVLFPVFTDYDFVNHKSLGSPRVPYTFFIKRNLNNIVAFTHEGIFENSQDVIIKIKEILRNIK